MEIPNPMGPRCPVRTSLELLGGKWRTLILHILREEELRFGAIRSLIPDISEKMLVQELKILVQNELLHRTNFGEVPPRVTYRLTEKGRLALPLIDAMRDFGLKYMEALYQEEKSPK